MQCPTCSASSRNFKSYPPTVTTRREYKCLRCRTRWVTYETIHQATITPYPTKNQ